MKTFIHTMFRRTAGKVTNSPRAETRRPLLVERLEDRSVPAVWLPAPGQPGAAMLVGTDDADQFIVRAAPSWGPIAAFQFSDDGGETFHTAYQNDVTRIVVRGFGGDDRLTIDNSLGFVAKSNRLLISFDGGYDRDELVLRGGPGAGLNETYAVAPFGGTGSVSTTDGFLTQMVKFTTLASIVDTVPVESLKIFATGGSDLIEVFDGVEVDGLTTTRVAVTDMTPWGGGQFGWFDFANKSLVGVNGLGGDDLMVMGNPLATGLQGMVMDGGDGFDGCIHLSDHDVPIWHENIEWIEEPQ